MNKLECVIFDLDGVITDIEKLHYEAYRRAFEINGLELTIETFNSKLRSKGRKLGLYNILGNGKEELKDKIGIDKTAEFNKLLDGTNIEIFEDTRELINQLRKRSVKLGVATGSKHGKFVLDKLGIADVFDIIITGSEVTNNKPNPEIYNKVVEAIGCNVDNTIAIEDSEVGIKSALRAGLKVIYIHRNDINKVSEEILLNKRVKKVNILNVSTCIVLANHLLFRIIQTY